MTESAVIVTLSRVITGCGARSVNCSRRSICVVPGRIFVQFTLRGRSRKGDRKSTRLNSSNLGISYAVLCLKKKKRERRTCAGGERFDRLVVGLFVFVGYGIMEEDR